MKISNKERKKKILIEEIIFGFLGIVGTTIESKIGLGIFLLIVGLAMNFIPMSGEETKPIFFFWIGSSLLLVAFYLIITRIREIYSEK